MRATNTCAQESFLGIPNRGKQQRFTAMSIDQVEGGKIINRTIERYLAHEAADGPELAEGDAGGSTRRPASTGVLALWDYTA
ncbi:uncharacterized protein SOCE26_095050 [Sorangium cellulosum]|uniref:Uncharacterized protein n=1 Tax=Sorangium cellulosum TaxID=56 RepID=A0A2L0F951_SORCE|nr:uncharacterized protein SOCE26_095050 [Sorangium cellulosum]